MVVEVPEVEGVGGETVWHFIFLLLWELAERVDIFARKQDLERSEALLRLIEGGLMQAEQAGISPPRERDGKDAEKHRYAG